MGCNSCEFAARTTRKRAVSTKRKAKATSLSLGSSSSRRPRTRTRARVPTRTVTRYRYVRSAPRPRPVRTVTRVVYVKKPKKIRLLPKLRYHGFLNDYAYGYGYPYSGSSTTNITVSAPKAPKPPSGPARTKSASVNDDAKEQKERYGREVKEQPRTKSTSTDPEPSNMPQWSAMNVRRRSQTNIKRSRVRKSVVLSLSLR